MAAPPLHRGARPIISVDTKKRELVGQFKNPGRVWSRAPPPVHDHDFPSLGLGIAIPYGIWRWRGQSRLRPIGTSRNTPDFAAESIRHWWLHDGRRRYPNASRLLILADNGGSNGAVAGSWKHAPQTKLVDPFALCVTVCHYPTGASEAESHRTQAVLRNQQTMAGPVRCKRPCDDRVSSARPAPDSGLTVACELNPKRYLTGIKLAPDQIDKISLHRHPVLPDWNYTLLPNESGN
ncbi:MAG: hypothetical protein HS122_02015 [Opitutaceae bacterium]|nr:hypothetical protein [Opitutaceae bacterium]